MREMRHLTAVGIQAGIVEAVAVDESRPSAVSMRTRFGCGCPGLGFGVMLLAVTAPNPRPMARRRMAVS